ncbi:hypothetical protein [Paracoccus sp. ME4]|uniref:hypothetical protein n=1 Tax=Paracoccus sp. ME4 TaxID=3138066 RepID=UPI00398ADA54
MVVRDLREDRIMIPAVVNSVAETIEGIKNFQGAMKGMGDRLSMARAWYAYRTEAGDWIFGPSKFIGYQNLSVKDYLEHASEMDGRKTEARLQDWFEELNDEHPLRAELFAQLSQKLADHGKTPSKMARISVLANQLTAPDAQDMSAKVIELIVAISQMLPIEAQKELKRRI